MAEFEEIMEKDADITWNGNNAIKWLNIINKYLPKIGVEGAEHDIIYSCDATELLDAGLTKKDAEKLRSINWMINDGIMACYV